MTEASRRVAKLVRAFERGFYSVDGPWQKNQQAAVEYVAIAVDEEYRPLLEAVDALREAIARYDDFPTRVPASVRLAKERVDALLAEQRATMAPEE